MNGIRRYTINDVYSNRFYQVPKFLFEGDFKAKLSSDAKLLYALLKDRHELSIKNGWVDSKGEVYLYYTRAEMCDKLGCGKDKAIKLCNELKSFGLFEEVRQGLNKPNIIYLSYIDYQEISSQTPEKPSYYAEVGKSELQKSENQKSGSLENRILNFGKTDPIDTDDNTTDLTNQSINQEISNDEIDAIIKENIEYDYCKENREDLFDFIDSCYELICEVMHSDTEFIRIAKTNQPSSHVKDRFLKLSLSHLEYVYECLEKNNGGVSNIKSYLLTSLYNAPTTFDTYYQQGVNCIINSKNS